MPLHERCKAGHFHSIQLAPLLQPCNEPGIISKLNNSVYPPRVNEFYQLVMTVFESK